MYVYVCVVLYKGMQLPDSDTGQPRGYTLITRQTPVVAATQNAACKKNTTTHTHTHTQPVEMYTDTQTQQALSGTTSHTRTHTQPNADEDVDGDDSCNTVLGSTSQALSLFRVSHTTHHTPYTIHHHTLHTIHHTLYTVHRTLHTIHHKPYFAHRTSYIV